METGSPAKARFLMKIDIVKPMPPRMPAPTRWPQGSRRAGWRGRPRRETAKRDHAQGLAQQQPGQDAEAVPAGEARIQSAPMTTPVLARAKSGRMTKATGLCRSAPAVRGRRLVFVLGGVGNRERQRDARDRGVHARLQHEVPHQRAAEQVRHHGHDPEKPVEDRPARSRPPAAPRRYRARTPPCRPAAMMTIAPRSSITAKATTKTLSDGGTRLPEHGQHPQRERDVRGHRDADAGLRRRSRVEGEVDQRPAPPCRRPPRTSATARS